MAKALVGDTIVAESDETVKIEGNYYFPPQSVDMQYFSEPTELHTTCHWKGEASYRDVKADGEVLKNAAWFYPSPPEDAIKRVGVDFSNYVAFYPQVTIVE